MSCTEIPVLRDTVVLRAAVPAGHFVTIDGALPQAGGQAYGPTYASATAGQKVAVTLLGITPAVAGAAIQPGAELEVLANGRLKPATAGRVVAIARDAASGDGETLRVLVLHGPAPGQSPNNPLGMVLPDGDDVHPRLRWDAGTGWTPTPDETGSYVGVTRGDDFASISAPILYALRNGLRWYPPQNTPADPGLEPFAIGVGNAARYLSASNQNEQFASVWRDGGPAPFVWIAVPSWTEWAGHYRLFYRQASDGLQDQVTGDLPWRLLRSLMRINGVAYDVQISTGGLPGARPASGQFAQLSVVWNPPAQPDPVVLEIV